MSTTMPMLSQIMTPAIADEKVNALNKVYYNRMLAQLRQYMAAKDNPNFGNLYSQVANNWNDQPGSREHQLQMLLGVGGQDAVDYWNNTAKPAEIARWTGIYNDPMSGTGPNTTWDMARRNLANLQGYSGISAPTEQSTLPSDWRPDLGNTPVNNQSVAPVQQTPQYTSLGQMLGSYSNQQTPLLSNMVRQAPTNNMATRTIPENPTYALSSLYKVRR